jgi:hypothetical protein
VTSVFETISRDGFAFLHGEETLSLLGGEAVLADWDAFAASWNRLELDTYMADGGRYRRRRHAVYAAAPGGAILRQPHQPHYQTLDYNKLNGGIARDFQPIEEGVAAGPSMTAILAFCRDLFEHLSDIRAWHIELHQFRIEAGPGQAGQPTPEGMHRDGVDYVLVLLIDRQNIASGVTTIHDLQRTLLGSFTLTEKLDAALVYDRRVYHGVTPVEPLDPAAPAHRDVLVVTFRASLAAS